MTKSPQAAILLIGNELLSGRVPDENLEFLASELWKLGVRVSETRIITDEQAAIVNAVKQLSAGNDWLLTTGGIGPTHDDITVNAVAAAFGVEVQVHPELEAAIRGRCGEQTTAAHLRMARVPVGCTLEGGAEGTWPTIRIGNTFIFPGIPAIVRRKFSRLKPFFDQGRFHRVLVETTEDETLIADLLGEIDQEFTEVLIGSYPEPTRVIISFEGSEPDLVEQAAQSLRDRIG